MRLAGRHGLISLALIVALSLASRAPAQSPGESGLNWQQRFLGILPLVKPDPKDPIVATVNGTPITLAQVDSYAKTEAQLINATSTEENRAAWRDALDNLINRTLLAQEAARRKIKIGDAEAAARAREFQLTTSGSNTEPVSGAPDQLLVSEVRRTIQIQRMLEQVFKGAHVTPTQAQIQKYYNEHKDLFIADPGEVRISHIAVRLPPSPTEQQNKQAMAKIEKLYDEAAKTKDFAALAKRYSEDQHSAARGGDLGYFRPGQLPPVVEKQAFSTKVGHLSDLIASNLGYSFLKVTEKRGATYSPFKDVRQKIALVLLNYDQDDAVKALLRKLHASSKIEFHEAGKHAG